MLVHLPDGSTTNPLALPPWREQPDPVSPRWNIPKQSTSNRTRAAFPPHRLSLPWSTILSKGTGIWFGP